MQPFVVTTKSGVIQPVGVKVVFGIGNDILALGRSSRLMGTNYGPDSARRYALRIARASDNAW